jgi:glycosyltransferase 2 family protein
LRLSPIIRVGISLGVLVAILWRVPAVALWAALQNLDGAWLWPALATALATLCIRTLKWQRLLQAGGSRASTLDAMRSLFGGFALGAVTPGRLGEFGRCLFIAGVERSAVTPLNVLDRFLDSWSVGTCAVVSLFLAQRRPAGIIALALWLALIPVVLALPRLVSQLGQRSWWRRLIGLKLRNAGPALATMAVAPFAGWALLSTSLDVVTFYFLLRMFHPAGFITAPATYPWIVMASGVPLSLGGLGLREGAAVLLLSHYAIPPAVATDVALFLFAFLSLLPALCGGMLLVFARPGIGGWPLGLHTPRMQTSLQAGCRMSEKIVKASPRV